MGRISRLGALVVALLGLAVPAAAARSGWSFHTTDRNPGAWVDQNTGRHCGARLGTYTVVRRRTFESGVFAGETEVLTATIALRPDGLEHRFHFVSLGGGVWRALNGAQRRTVRRNVKSTLRSQGEKVLGVQGNRLLVDAYEPGKPVQTEVVTLHTTHC